MGQTHNWEEKYIALCNSVHRIFDSIGIYPASTTTDGVTKERTPYQDGWNACALKVIDIFDSIDEEIKAETISHRTAQRNKEPEFREKVSNGLKKLFGSLEERFFNYVKKEKNGCWICSKKTIMHDGIEYKSKEVSLKLHNIKQTAECITTKCGNIKCVNPKHLICVSREDTALLTVKNRKNISRGNGHPSKLSVSDVNNIKKMINTALYTSGLENDIDIMIESSPIYYITSKNPYEDIEHSKFIQALDSLSKNLENYISIEIINEQTNN
jgi:hypothetical protein